MDVFPVYLTLKVSVVATFFSVAIGLALAWLMARKDFWGKGVLDAIIMQPLVIPPTVLGYYLLVLLGRSGTVGRFLEEVLKTITVPLAWRGIIAGAVMAFARATGEFGATLMVAGNIPGMTQTLSIAIYDAVQMGNTKMANMLVGIITIFSFLILYFVNRFTRGR